MAKFDPVERNGASMWSDLQQLAGELLMENEQMRQSCGMQSD
jgi:hypothetical protein